MKKTDMDIKMFEEQLARVSKIIKKQKADHGCNTFYTCASDTLSGIQEYDFQSAADFRKMLAERKNNGNCIFEEFNTVCTASLFKYYNSRPEDTEHRKISDFTYEF